MTGETPRPTLGVGNISVVIDGEHMELVPSYAAAAAISARGAGLGLRGTMEKVLALDAETIIEVIIVGLGYGPGRRPPTDLRERIWRTGFMLASGGLADATFDYIRILANGGRPLPEDGVGGTEGAPAPVDPPPAGA